MRCREALINQQHNLYAMNADGSGQQLLQQHIDASSGYDILPDGTRITFAAERDGDLEIYSTDASGSDLEKLTNNAVDDYSPVFSPPVSRIAFVSEQDDNAEIYTMKTDDTELQNISRNPSMDTQPGVELGEWQAGVCEPQGWQRGDILRKSGWYRPGKSEQPSRV